MKSILLLIILFIVFSFVFPTLQIFCIKTLCYMDKKKDYSNYKYKLVKEEDKIIIEYLIWELHKLEDIKKKYKETIEYKDKVYEVDFFQEESVSGKLHFNQRIIFHIKKVD
ncbi:MAG: hypothetical protein ACK5NF_01380 [Bacilli bacterium]